MSITEGGEAWEAARAIMRRCGLSPDTTERIQAFVYDLPLAEQEWRALVAQWRKLVRTDPNDTFLTIVYAVILLYQHAGAPPVPSAIQETDARTPKLRDNALSILRYWLIFPDFGRADFAHVLERMKEHFEAPRTS